VFNLDQFFFVWGQQLDKVLGKKPAAFRVLNHVNPFCANLCHQKGECKQPERAVGITAIMRRR